MTEMCSMDNSHMDNSHMDNPHIDNPYIDKPHIDKPYKGKLRTGTGLIHIYCGDGKGKTTAGMGLCVRAAGYGYKVVICQFMKDNTSSERNLLEQVKNITLLPGLSREKFSFRMTEEEKAERRAFYNEQLKKAADCARETDAQVLFLDEALYCIGAGLLSEDLLVDFLENKPDQLEVILTGQHPGERVLALADYVSEIKKVKHPFDWQQAARDGIER